MNWIYYGEAIEILDISYNSNDMRIGNRQIQVLQENSDKINLYCMYALRPSPSSYPIDDKVRKFGEAALVFYRPQDFIDRVTSKLREEGIEARADLVEYISDDHSGPLGTFTKLASFAWQSEWRLMTLDGPGGPRRLCLGDLRDISRACSTSEINSIFKIKYDSEDRKHGLL